MSAYLEKLKDPRWQKKRLEAMSHANFACEACFNKEETLHVHHKQYFKGREPWDYDVEQLAVLCKSCHESEHDELDPLLLAASYVEIDGPYGRYSAASLLNGFVGRDIQQDSDPLAHMAGRLARCQQDMEVNDLITFDEMSKKDLLTALHLLAVKIRQGGKG